MEGDPEGILRQETGWYFNPLPPHGGRQIQFRIICTSIFISIHSLRMEGDIVLDTDGKYPNSISIHSLRMEGD